jgi:hypothetical protein
VGDIPCVSRNQIVNRRHAVSLGEKAVTEVGTQEPGTTGDDGMF